MYWSENTITGCFHGAEPDDEQLVRLKGFRSEQQLETARQKGRQEIERMMILDKYYHYVLEIGESPIRGRIRKEYPLTFRGHKWTDGLIATAAKAKVFRKFLEDNELEDVSLEGLLGIETSVLRKIRGLTE